jgi:antirestriction protein ArdC
MTEKVQVALTSIIEKFESGAVPEAIAFSIFPMADIPAAKWSLMNRVLLFIAGTEDARGFRQWEDVGRHVKRGAKAITILAPRFVRKKSEETAEEKDKKKVLAGFLAVPVFRAEDTEGEPLEYQRIELPDLPLIEVAMSWGISVKAIPNNYRYWGYFSRQRNEIAIATKEESVFFHELAHAAHQKLLGELKNGQDWKQEIVAELAAAVLCKIVGKTSDSLGNSYRYIETYAKQVHLTAAQGCLKVMGDVEKVLNLILKGRVEEAARESLPVV